DGGGWPWVRGSIILDRSAAHLRGGQRGQTRWTGQTRVSSRVPSAGDRLAGDRPEGGGRGTRPGDQRAGNLWLAPAGADRPWAGTGAEDGGAGRARRGQTADPRARSGVGCASAGGGGAEGGGGTHKRGCGDA